MRRQWALFSIEVIAITLGMYHLLWPPQPKVSLLPVSIGFREELARPSTTLTLTLRVYDIADIASDEEKAEQIKDVLLAHIQYRELAIYMTVSRHYLMPINLSVESGAWGRRGKRLYIFDSPENHQRIADLLAAIRRADKLEWAWKAK